MGGKRLRGRVVPRLTDTEDPLPSYRRGSGSVAPAGCLRRIPTGALPSGTKENSAKNVNGQV
jgi:hypothetical protein